MEHILKVTPEEIKEEGRKHMAPFVVEDKSRCAQVCPSGKLDKVLQLFEK
jgi:hypothetical protein